MNFTRTLITGLLLTLTQSAQSADLVSVTVEQQQQLGITTAKPAADSSGTSAAVPAQVVIPPGQERIVASTEPARIVSLEVSTDEEVEQGQVLATLASAAFLTMQKDYLQALTEYNLAASQIKRDRLLADEGIIATKRLQESSTRFNNQKILLQQQESSLQIAGFSAAEIRQLKQSGRLLQTIPLRAPMQGVVLEKMVDVGSQLEAGDPVFRVASLDSLWLEIRVPVEEAAQLNTESVFGVEDRDVSARLLSKSKNVDPESQTLLVRAEITSGDDAVRPGEVVNVRLTGSGESATRLLRLPRNAVVRSADQHYVFVQTSGGFNATPVEIAGYRDDQALISSGLQAEDVIAVTGIISLKAAWSGLGGGE